MALQPNEVKAEHISAGAVTTPKIADEQVTSAKIKNSAVTSEKLATGAVTGSKLSENAVTGSKIRDGTVRSEKIASGAVTTAKIGEAQVTGSRLQDRAVTTEKIANSSITTEKIANGAVTPAKLSFTPPPMSRPISPPVTNAELGNGSVTTEKITPQSVSREKLDPAVIESFGSKIVMQPPEWIREPATYENAVPWTELPLATHLPEGTFAVLLQAEISLPAQEVPGWQAGNPEMLEPSAMSLNVRKDASENNVALSVGHQGGVPGVLHSNQGIVAVTAARTIEWNLEFAYVGLQRKITVAIKLVGYII